MFVAGVSVEHFDLVTKAILEMLCYPLRATVSLTNEVDGFYGTQGPLFDVHGQHLALSAAVIKGLGGGSCRHELFLRQRWRGIRKHHCHEKEDRHGPPRA